MTAKPQFHGSDLESIEQYYGIPKEEIISFSANVNPLGISPMLRKHLETHIDAITLYPDREYTDLRRAISAYCGAPLEQILVGSGATELISRFVKETLPKKIMLVNPTYSEYAREIGLEGGELVSYQLPESSEFHMDVSDFTARLDSSFDLLILCNPNNPTGSALHHAQLREILRHCRGCGIHVLIDETYVEFADQLEDITAIPLASEFDNLFVLRGISKFFAAPGLRLGYAVTGSEAIRRRINETKNPWSINSLAAVSGACMFQDAAYIRSTREFTHSERLRVLEQLRKIPAVHVFESESNFFLLRILREDVTSETVFDRLIRDRMMLRDCASFPGLGTNHIRFCLCRPEQNDRLLAGLQQLLQ
jgi:threonine-phosphate decarboxylase